MGKEISDDDDKSTPLDPSPPNQQQQESLPSSAQEADNTVGVGTTENNKTTLRSNSNSSNNNNNNSKLISEHSSSINTSNSNIILTEQQQRKAEMMADEDPLLISQSLTYVTDDGGILHTFQSSPFSFGFKLQFVVLEIVFIVLMIAAVPIGAHGTVVGVCVANLVLLAWFWYNLVRSVDVTTDGTLRFWIGNIEIEVPFDKIIVMNRVASSFPGCACCICGISSLPYRGFLATPNDGVAIVTTVPSTPFWLWPRSAGKPDRSCCFGLLSCPRLTVVFSPAGGSLNFIREVENEMKNFAASGNKHSTKSTGNRPNATISIPRTNQHDYLDV